MIEFADEETATKNIEQLKQQKLDVSLLGDFVRSPSVVTFVTPAMFPRCDPLKLYVTRFSGRKITVKQLKKMFPTCDDVTLPLNPMDNNRPIG